MAGERLQDRVRVPAGLKRRHELQEVRPLNHGEFGTLTDGQPGVRMSNMSNMRRPARFPGGVPPVKLRVSVLLDSLPALE